MSNEVPLNIVYVVMGNDFPCSVSSTEEKANEYINECKINDRVYFRGRIHYKLYKYLVDGPLEKMS